MDEGRNVIFWGRWQVSKRWISSSWHASRCMDTVCTPLRSPSPPACAHKHPSHTPSPVAHSTMSHLTTHVAQPCCAPNQARNHGFCPHPSSPASALPAPVSSLHPIPMHTQSAPSPHMCTCLAPSPQPALMLSRNRPTCIQLYTRTLSHHVCTCTSLVYLNSTMSGSNCSHATVKSTHTLDRTMETLFVEACGKEGEGWALEHDTRA